MPAGSSILMVTLPGACTLGVAESMNTKSTPGAFTIFWVKASPSALTVPSEPAITVPSPIGIV